MDLELRLHGFCLGITEANGHLLRTAFAKLWFANELGPLTVHAIPILFGEMHNGWLWNADKHWPRQEEESALVLPVVSKGRSNQKKMVKNMGALEHHKLEWVAGRSFQNIQSLWWNRLFTSLATWTHA